jgi:UMF1 family MFS transporter
MLLILVAVGVASIGKAHILFVVPVAPPHPGDGLFASLPERMFMALGLVIGFVVGPIQASARSLLARLTPPENAGRMFGLLALSGKVTSFLAPLLIAIATDLSGTQAAAPLVVIAFFLLGWLVLRKVAEPGGASSNAR